MDQHQIDRRPHGAGVLNSSDAWQSHDRLGAPAGAAGDQMTINESHRFSLKALACCTCGATYPRSRDALWAECGDVDDVTYAERIKSGILPPIGTEQP